MSRRGTDLRNRRDTRLLVYAVGDRDALATAAEASGVASCVLVDSASRSDVQHADGLHLFLNAVHHPITAYPEAPAPLQVSSEGLGPGWARVFGQGVDVLPKGSL
jgi:hypothetical protein